MSLRVFLLEIFIKGFNPFTPIDRLVNKTKTGYGKWNVGIGSERVKYLS